MKNKPKSTFEKFLSDPKQKALYDKEYKELILSELLIAAMEKDQISVRRLAKEAGVSPTVIQGIRSGEKKDIRLSTLKQILSVFGYSLCIEKGRKHIYI